MSVVASVKKQSFLWLRMVSVLIDFSAIYSITILLAALIYTIVYIDYDTILIIVFIAYYFVSYLFFDGKTPAKSITGIEVGKMDRAALSFKNIFLREFLAKGVLGLLLPLWILNHVFPLKVILFTVAVFILLLAVSLLLLLIFKRCWWEMMSLTQTSKAAAPKKAVQHAFIFITVVLLLSVCYTILPYTIGKKQIQTSFSYPAYPETNEIKQYTHFIKTEANNPVDYLFGLFQKNDLVVLSERMHTEYTQYELLDKVISDPRFIKEVGNIFTECGSVSFQDTLNTYLHTVYKTEDDLNKATAFLQRNSNAIWPLWDNTNLFDLLKKVNTLNAALPDSEKINWYFTDLEVNWETMTHEKFIQSYTNPLRDSLMAVHAIIHYQENIAQHKRKKGLVIMNTRHGYGLIDEKFGKSIQQKYLGTAAFLMRSFPGKVATVLINSVSIQYGYLFTPIQNGKWDRAFELVGNPEKGFDFKGSPFGEDVFDAGFFSKQSLRYQDVFTGFIFYKPLSKHIERNGFPHEFDGFEDTALRRQACVNKETAESYKNYILLYKQHPEMPVVNGQVKYAFMYNLINIELVPVLLVLAYLIAAIFFIRKRIKKE